MASYKIIGDDHKQYGPVSAEDLRQWIADGRLNGQSLAQVQGDIEWKQLSTFPEFADMFAAESAASSAPPPAPAPAHWLEHDYELHIGDCIGQGWELLKNNFGLLFVSSLIYLLIEGAIAGLGAIPFAGPVFSIANLIIVGPLMGGVFYIFIRTIRSQPTNVGDVFAGFRRSFARLFLGYLVPALLMCLSFIPFVLVVLFMILPAAGHHQSPSHAAPFILLGAMLICMIPAIYLQTNWTFTLPLIIDRQMDFWLAMKASWKMVSKHWWHVFGLTILIGLLNLVGLLVCCVGMLFTVPISIGALMYAYEAIFTSPRIG